MRTLLQVMPTGLRIKTYKNLAADAESFQWVEAEPTSVPSLLEAVHKFRVERPLQGRESHQEHMLLLGGQLVLQNIMTSSGMRMEVIS